MLGTDSRQEVLTAVQMILLVVAFVHMGSSLTMKKKKKQDYFHLCVKIEACESFRQKTECEGI